MRDVAGRSTESLFGREDADTDVSDHRADVTSQGRKNVSCVGLDVPVFGEEDRRPLHCVYDFHRCHTADVPDVIAAARR